MKLVPIDHRSDYCWFEHDKPKYALVGHMSNKVHVVCTSLEIARLIKKTIEEKFTYDAGYEIMKVVEQ